MNNIKKARLHRGMSQAELGKAVGLSASAIGMIEQGRRTPSISTLERLSDVLKYSPMYLMGARRTPWIQFIKNEDGEDSVEFLKENPNGPVSISDETIKSFVSPKTVSYPPIFKMLMMDDPELAKIVNATKVVGEHDVVSHGKLISISPAKLELFHAALKAILEIGG